MATIDANGVTLNRRRLRRTRPAMLPDIRAGSQEHELRLADHPALEPLESRDRGDLDLLVFLEDREPIGQKPASGAGGSERGFAEALAIGRIDEGEREGDDRAGDAEAGGIATEDARAAGEAECFDVPSNETASLDGVLDEERIGGAAGESLETERPGTGKEIENPRARDDLAVGMGEDIEERLPQPVGARADRAAECDAAHIHHGDGGGGDEPGAGHFGVRRPLRFLAAASPGRLAVRSLWMGITLRFAPGPPLLTFEA